MQDPRYTTFHASDYKGTLFHERKDGVFYLPATTREIWCRPGYQPKREDKGVSLTVNDYTYHSLQYGGKWSKVVNTPFKDDN